jgi:hypothetical protein
MLWIATQAPPWRWTILSFKRRLRRETRAGALGMAGLDIKIVDALPVPIPGAETPAPEPDTKNSTRCSLR